MPSAGRLGRAEILWIAVDPARRGRGLRTVLLDSMMADLAAAGSAWSRPRPWTARQGTRCIRPCDRSGSAGLGPVYKVDSLPGVAARQPGGHLRCGSAAHAVTSARLTSSAPDRARCRRKATAQITAVILSPFCISPGHEEFLRLRHVADVRFSARLRTQKRSDKGIDAGHGGDIASGAS